MAILFQWTKVMLNALFHTPRDDLRMEYMTQSLRNTVVSLPIIHINLFLNSYPQDLSGAYWMTVWNTFYYILKVHAKKSVSPMSLMAK